MKKQKDTSPTDTAEVEIDVTDAIEDGGTPEVVPTAMVPATRATPVAAPAPAQEDDPVRAIELRIEATGDRLRQIAEEFPDLQEKLEDLAMYAVARVEGVAEGRGVVIPNIQVRQQMTKSESLPGDVKVGELYTKQMPVGSKLNFIPLFIHNKRVKFTPGADRPECFSNDGVTGSKWGTCATCPHARFEAGQSASCSSGRSVAAVDSNFEHLYMIDFIKTSARTGKKLLALASGPHGVFKNVFELFTEKEKNTKGEFYVLRVNATGKSLRGGEYQAARALCHFFEARHELSKAKALAFGGGETVIHNQAGATAPISGGGEQEPDFSEGFS